jgi:hypothetical protein
MADTIATCPADCTSLIPQPVVRLNRLTILVGVVVGCLLHVPLITTALFAIVTLAATFGRRASLIYWIGTIVLRPSTSRPDGEDPRLMRFNNMLAALFSARPKSRSSFMRRSSVGSSPDLPLSRPRSRSRDSVSVAFCSINSS